ncbi:hypothetical protein L1987_70798 [Smallanthus sonchifolius]|uniref:Uncharacterized protein n=1 Tax=Smallanthus sonchifolius TaxID=185202 RepID=A0ACB9AQ20_9ASTR|nr:hypothetical protein L1987_70798 [Smallanthus sonchifolius]
MIIFTPNCTPRLIPKDEPDEVADEIMEDILSDGSQVQTIVKSQVNELDTNVESHQTTAHEQLLIEDDVFPFSITANNRMRLPVKVVRMAELDEKNSLIVIDVNGVQSQLGVRIEMSKTSKRYALSGWTAFMKANSIIPGDICSFNLIKSKSTIHLTSVEKHN